MYSCFEIAHSRDGKLVLACHVKDPQAEGYPVSAEEVVPQNEEMKEVEGTAGAVAAADASAEVGSLTTQTGKKEAVARIRLPVMLKLSPVKRNLFHQPRKYPKRCAFKSAGARRCRRFATACAEDGEGAPVFCSEHVQVGQIRRPKKLKQRCQQKLCRKSAVGPSSGGQEGKVFCSLHGGQLDVAETHVSRIRGSPARKKTRHSRPEPEDQVSPQSPPPHQLTPQSPPLRQLSPQTPPQSPDEERSAGPAADVPAEGEGQRVLADRRLVALDDEASAEVQLAYDEGDSKDIVAMAFGVQLERRGLASLRPGKCLTDEAINFWMEILQERATREGRRHMFLSSFFIQKMHPPESFYYEYDNIRRYRTKREATTIYCDPSRPPVITPDKWSGQVQHIRTPRVY